MKTRSSLAAVLMVVMLILLASCAPQLALHPWYTDKDLVLEPGFAGAWYFVDEGKADESAVFTMTQDIANGYTISLADASQPDVRTLWEGRLFRVNGQMFIDAMQLHTKYKGEELVELFIPAHMVGTVKLEGDKLSLHFLDDEWMGKALRVNPGLIKHEMVEENALLMASTAELREFAVAHAADDKAFSSNFDFVRKK